ncbi:MAG: hypothetical protein QXK89_06515 [Candidatus Bathyarchaeia archaeon]
MEEKSKAARTPIFLVSIILIMLIMSLAMLLLAVGTYLTQKTIEPMNVILSISAIALSIYLLFQLRRKPLSLGFEAIKVTTVIKCTKCNYENAREFEKGDYVLKEVGSCPKCNGALLIHSIFREVKEKERFD